MPTAQSIVSSNQRTNFITNQLRAPTAKQRQIGFAAHKVFDVAAIGKQGAADLRLRGALLEQLHNFFNAFALLGIQPRRRFGLRLMLRAACD